MPKLKLPDPSTKNGRRSEKNVSNAVRFTTAGSASTWPKSGLMVPVNVRPGVSAYFRSMPIDAFGFEADSSGLPSGRCRVRFATVYGTISSRFGEPPIDRPPSSPNDDT